MKKKDLNLLVTALALSVPILSTATNAIKTNARIIPHLQSKVDLKVQV